MNGKGGISGGLDTNQREAVEAIDGPLLVVSGPGAGKTTTVVNRIAHLIDQGIKPENICALTFTNRAGREIRERAYSIIGDRVNRVFIGTIHLLGLRILKDSGYRDFLLIDREKQLSIIGSLVKKDGNREAEKILEAISRIKNHTDVLNEGIRGIYDTYESYLFREKFLDFDDLIKKPLEIVESDRSSNPYRGKFSHIIVDEYQDINYGQYRLIRLLLNNGGSICAVGDSDQAIYTFRGADIENFLNFEKDFKGARKVTLSFNYRSTGRIVYASSKVIENNRRRIEKRLEGKREEGERIKVVSVPDERYEGLFIVGEIEHLIGGTSHYNLYRKGATISENEKNYTFSDFAVLYRTNAQVSAIEGAFTTSGIPYRVIGRENSQKKKIIKEILSSPGGKYSFDEGCLNTILDRMIPVFTYRPHYTFQSREEIIDFINEFCLLSPADDYDREVDAVSLMTIHMAKGLEFKVVFLVGVEDGIIPFSLKGESVDMEEERRLFYVGMTRAADRLYLIHSDRRVIYGKLRDMSRSRFISEIPDEFVERVFPFEKGRKRQKNRQMSLFGD
ncbi:MAG: ATP-dependent helicase [Syntrophorhabdaceae bacterium]|nr:ATP-dependent helicase [Syntrophorhabdaceae bacterium]